MFLDITYCSLLDPCCLLSKLILIILLVHHLPLIKNFSSSPLSSLYSWKAIISRFGSSFMFPMPELSPAALHALLQVYKWIHPQNRHHNRKPCQAKLGWKSLLCALMATWPVIKLSWGCLLTVEWLARKQPPQAPSSHPICCISSICKSATYLVVILRQCLQ